MYFRVKSFLDVMSRNCSIRVFKLDTGGTLTMVGRSPVIKKSHTYTHRYTGRSELPPSHCSLSSLSQSDNRSLSYQ